MVCYAVASSGTFAAAGAGGLVGSIGLEAAAEAAGGAGGVLGEVEVAVEEEVEGGTEAVAGRTDGVEVADGEAEEGGTEEAVVGRAGRASDASGVGGGVLLAISA